MAEPRLLTSKSPPVFALKCHFSNGIYAFELDFIRRTITNKGESRKRSNNKGRRRLPKVKSARVSHRYAAAFFILLWLRWQGQAERLISWPFLQAQLGETGSPQTFALSFIKNYANHIEPRLDSIFLYEFLLRRQGVSGFWLNRDVRVLGFDMPTKCTGTDNKVA